MLKRFLFGNEAKLQFKTSTTNGIARLYSEANISPLDKLYWQKYVCLFDSASDVFTLLSIADVRRALIRHPENIATLVNVLIAHLECLQDDSLFSPLPRHDGIGSGPSNVLSVAGQSLGRLGSQASSSAFTLVNDGARRAASFGTLLSGGGGGGGGEANDREVVQRDRCKEALNCCRILTRLLPIIMEGDHDSTCNVQADGGLDQRAALDTDLFENQLFWSTPSNDVEQRERFLLYAQTKSSSLQADTHDDFIASQEEQFVIEEDEEEDLEAERDHEYESRPGSMRNPLSDLTGEKEGEQIGAKMKSALPKSLGERMTKAIVNLLFYSGFTIPWTDELLVASATSTSIANSRTQYAIWEKGIGSSSDIEGQTRTHEGHRLELLRLLLVLLSKNVYVTPTVQRSTDNHSLRILVSSLERSIVLPLLCSLLNTSVVWVAKKENWLASLTSLPAGLVKDRLNGGQEDVRQSTVTISLQLLNIVSAYEFPLSPEEIEQTDGASHLSPNMNTYSVPGTPRTVRPSLHHALSTQSLASGRTPSKDGQQNLFRFYLSKLHRHSDFVLLADGIFAVIGQRPSAAALLNPSTASQVTDTSAAGPHVPEVLLLLWRLLRHNVKFRTFLLDDRSPQLLSHLLFHALNNKDSAARQGLVRLIVFILHDISCERTFAVNICKAGSGAKARITGGQRWGVAVGSGSGSGAGAASVTTATAPSGQASQASTGADILIQAVYALIATTKSTLSILYSPMVITLTNISPYFKGLSIFSANRLLALFTSFSNSAFLLADEGNPRVLFYLIEVLNNIVQHGFQRNPNVAYAIVRNHVAIERLANFTLRRGIADIRRSRRRTGLMGNIVSSPRSEFAPAMSEQLADRSASAIGSVDNLSLAAGEAGKPDSVAMRQSDSRTSSLNASTASLTRTEGATSTLSNPPPASEKARGKMRRSSTSSSDVSAQAVRSSLAGVALEEDEEDDLVNGFNEQELYLAACTVGRNGFVPTQAWVTSWHKGLPLDVLQLTVVELVPRVQELCRRMGTKSDADERVLAWLREQNLESVLPPSSTSTPAPRAFKWTPQVSIWLLSYVWGLVYVTSTLPYGLFNGSCARLFQLRVHDGGRGVATSTQPSTPTRRSGEHASAANGVGRSSFAASTTADRRTAAGAVTALAEETSGLVGGVGSMMMGSITSVLGLGINQQAQPGSPRTQRQDQNNLLPVRSNTSGTV